VTVSSGTKEWLLARSCYHEPMAETAAPPLFVQDLLAIFQSKVQASLISQWQSVTSSHTLIQVSVQVFFVGTHDIGVLDSKIPVL